MAEYPSALRCIARNAHVHAMRLSSEEVTMRRDAPSSIVHPIWRRWGGVSLLLQAIMKAPSQAA